MLKAGGPPLIALLGCGCSPATEPVAEVSGFSDIVHVRMYRMFAIMSHFATVLYVYSPTCMLSQQGFSIEVRAGEARATVFCTSLLSQQGIPGVAMCGIPV